MVVEEKEPLSDTVWVLEPLTLALGVLDTQAEAQEVPEALTESEADAVVEALPLGLCPPDVLAQDD